MGFRASLLFLTALFAVGVSRKHHLLLKNDVRKYFSITTFGFLKGGELEVNLYNLTFLSKDDGVFGLTLTRTVHDSLEPYIENSEKCLLLSDNQREDSGIEFVSFVLDSSSNEVSVNCSKLSTTLEIQPVYESNSSSNTDVRAPIASPLKLANGKSVAKRQIPDSDQDTHLKTSSNQLNSSAEVSQDEANDQLTQKPAESDDVKKVKLENIISNPPGSGICASHPKLHFTSEHVGDKKQISNLKFVVIIKNENAEGLYTLFFHNCAGIRKSAIPVNLSIVITERNEGSYLSAGEIPLPQLYFFMSCVFCVIGGIWLYVVRKKKGTAFKLHYLMGLLIFLKSLSLLFHGINFHIIAKDGFPMEAWAVLYYVTHLLKGALLFITIVLIGTGFAFIKHVLNDRDKKIFVVFIPLQVLANVAKIIMEESEEGNARYDYWREVFILVDLMCCGAILVPVVWSIKHLQEASETDGKAAINLKKLKLFRRFYIMIVCYIYFTRIIVYLLKITVPFQYEWMDEMFKEVATLIFFILTGYNFRPTSSNPYFRVTQEEDLDMDEVIVGMKCTDTVTKTMRSRDFAGHVQEKVPLKHESSHEYD